MDTGAQHYVLDAQYDYFGKRFATCSSDHSVRVWDQSLDSPATWRASGCIRGVSKIATQQLTDTNMVMSFADKGCDIEGLVGLPRVWTVVHVLLRKLLAVCSEDSSVTIWEEQTDIGGEEQGRSRWVCRATLKESMRPVKDLEFAPRHLGLKLATASADGVVRIYEAVDVMNMSHWQQQDTLEADKTPGDVALSISWNKNRFDPPSVVIGGNGVKVWQYDETGRKWEVIVTLVSPSVGVHDVSWAPKMGRSHHVIASAGKDYRVRIHHLKYSDRGQVMHSADEVREIDTKSEVWRVEWNVLGSLLAASGDDGIVRLWKRSQEVRDIEHPRLSLMTLRASLRSSLPVPQLLATQQKDWLACKVISKPLESDSLIM